MKILLLYPQYPETFWSLKYSLSFVGKKASIPPLGLLTIASLLPQNWETKLIDLNVEKLSEKDIIWADYIFISAMITQKESTKQIIHKCKEHNKKIVAGGPLFTSLPEEFPEVDHLVLDEGEVTLPQFLKDLENSQTQKYYRSEIKPDLSKSPIPKWDLIKQKYYMKMAIQCSRGCPYDCEFCDVVKLNGKIPRTKTPLQVIKELEALHQTGWKGSIFFVDDNFIGDKNKTKKILKGISRWKRLRKSNFTFMTQVSLNISEDQELMNLMKKAGFNSVFIGLETPSEESLAECGKFQNKGRDLISSVLTLYKNGFEVSAGFIVGFDSDDETIFKRQIEFIQNTGVVVAMIGMLQALPGTRLYKRLKKENRLLGSGSGNNTDFSTNFIPQLPISILQEGYKNIVSTIYSPKEYYGRVLTFIKNYNHSISDKVGLNEIIAFVKSIYIVGIFDSSRIYYWKLFFISLFKYPKAFQKVITMSIYYAHFKKIFIEQDFTNQYQAPQSNTERLLNCNLLK